MTTEKVYREGFLDGMRNCGFILEDVSDEDLNLNYDWKAAIQKGFEKRDYNTQTKELTDLFRESIIQAEQYKEDIALLRGLLTKANIEIDRLSNPQPSHLQG